MPLEFDEEDAAPRPGLSDKDRKRGGHGKGDPGGKGDPDEYRVPDAAEDKDVRAIVNPRMLKRIQRDAENDAKQKQLRDDLKKSRFVDSGVATNAHLKFDERFSSNQDVGVTQLVRLLQLARKRREKFMKGKKTGWEQKAVGGPGGILWYYKEWAKELVPSRPINQLTREFRFVKPAKMIFALHTTKLQLEKEKLRAITQAVQGVLEEPGLSEETREMINMGLDGRLGLDAFDLEEFEPQFRPQYVYDEIEDKDGKKVMEDVKAADDVENQKRAANRKEMLDKRVEETTKKAAECALQQRDISVTAKELIYAALNNSNIEPPKAHRGATKQFKFEDFDQSIMAPQVLDSDEEETDKLLGKVTKFVPKRKRDKAAAADEPPSARSRGDDPTPPSTGQDQWIDPSDIIEPAAAADGGDEKYDEYGGGGGDGRGFDDYDDDY